MDLKAKKRDAVYLMVAGVLFVIIGIIAYVIFGSFENGTLSTVSANSLVIILYKLLGKTGVLFVSVALGAGLYSWGRNRYRKLKKEEKNNNK